MACAPSPVSLGHRGEPTLTDHVIAATGQEAEPRLAELFPTLLRHVHDFIRGVGLTMTELMIAINFVCLILPCWLL